MMNLVLVSKRGNNVTVGELLESLTAANSNNGLTVKYVNQKPTVMFTHNSKGKLEMLSASVCYAMLNDKFVIAKAIAYEVSAWLSSNFGTTAPVTKKTLLTEEELEEKLLHKAMLISLLETIDIKMTKAEMLKVIEETKALIKEE